MIDRLPPGGATAALRALVLVVAALANPAAADDLDRLQSVIGRHAPEDVVLEASRRQAACAGDLRCFAETLVEVWPEGARLIAVPEPNAQLIRSGAATRSVAIVGRRVGVLRVRMDRFGHRADRQVLRALQGLRPDETLELDLRRHGGGSVNRMLEVASLFIGPRADAMRIVGQRGAVVFAAPAPARLIEPERIDVLIGPETRSRAEVLAALLHRYAGARLVGLPTFGKNWAERPIKIASGWYLMIRAGEIRIEGEVLEGGLTPDVPPGS